MAEKVSTLVITLNLSCCCCFTKIRKTLCKLQESEDIRAISYDKKQGTVTISGTFDPLVLPCKLRRKAGCVIRDIRLEEKSMPWMPEYKAEPKFAPLPRRGQQSAVPTKPPTPACLPAHAPACCCGACQCGGCSYHCCCSAFAFMNGAVPAPPCYGASYGGCSKIQITCEESSPACSIM
ncbi:protein PYRICULARIA ORYZAE RESISTANCE 21-like isoform X2 [Phragmites australis]|uniref:protein PYRICULARIA ORYZAE RESISTANCE 21-like isoform X2 n=1 Tax=Phragmites australis TaxID=29695 RepID=UPI002D78DFC7|nr:protein PYRICULARIA ORYZAE RESISTANCE 21-like isoform X2 [Phragmites australis]